MQTLSLDAPPARAPAWLWTAAAIGVPWNAYGLVQFIGGFTATGQAAMTAGMTPEQAALYLGLPAWITLAFAVGVFGGLLGTIALALRRRVARPVLALSLAGYVLLFAGDAWAGVFSAIPQQLAILAVVVVIAAGLAATAGAAARRGLLR